MGKSAPAPPDYSGAAQAQSQGSQTATAGQTSANRPNQSTGFASSQWAYNPNTGTWSQNVGLNGPLGTAQGEASQQAAANLATPIDNGTQTYNDVYGKVLNQEMQSLNPQMQQQSEANAAQLADEGLSPTSEGARAANNALNLQQNQEMTGAMGNAAQLANAEQQTTFGENVEQQQLPLQELGSLLGLEQQPGFTAAGAYQAPEYLAAAMGLGNYNLQGAGMQNQLMGSLGSGAGALGGAAINAFAM